MPKSRSTVFERGDHVYIVSPISPFDPSEIEIEEFAFAQELKKQAPSPHIKWLRGQYVEADTPNKNGQVWTSGEIAIKSLTPTFMPVTVMHDTRSAVGLIADTRLVTPAKDGVPKARIDNTLAIWAHRFPEVAEEIDQNYEQGSLMQSMECLSPYYSCGECGQTFHKLPRGAERANWCSHLLEGAGRAARILGNVVFTGTGLIFGTQGTEGANPKGHLEVFQEEVAEFHEKAHRETGTKPRRSDKKRRRRTSMDPVEISHEEYAKLHKRPSEEEFAAEKKRADEATEELAETNKKLEKTEAELNTSKEEKADVDKKLKEAEEEKAAVELKSERVGKLGDGFMHKLGEQTKKNLNEQASSMKDDEWESRLGELEELAGAKRDAKLQKGDGKEPATASSNGDGGESTKTGKDAEFSQEELASTVVIGTDGEEVASNGGSGEPSQTERASVARGLLGRKKTETKTE